MVVMVMCFMGRLSVCISCGARFYVSVIGGRIYTVRIRQEVGSKLMLFRARYGGGLKI
jgi:hypothetical protein